MEITAESLRVIKSLMEETADHYPAERFAMVLVASCAAFSGGLMALFAASA